MRHRGRGCPAQHTARRARAARARTSPPTATAVPSAAAGTGTAAHPCSKSPPTTGFEHPRSRVAIQIVGHGCAGNQWGRGGGPLPKEEALLWLRLPAACLLVPGAFGRLLARVVNTAKPANPNSSKQSAVALDRRGISGAERHGMIRWRAFSSRGNSRGKSTGGRSREQLRKELQKEVQSSSKSLVCTEQLSKLPRTGRRASSRRTERSRRKLGRASRSGSQTQATGSLQPNSVASACCVLACGRQAGHPDRDTHRLPTATCAAPRTGTAPGVGHRRRSNHSSLFSPIGRQTGKRGGRRGAAER